jgi:polysaccharide pyruvyl transferase CsaB
MLKPQRSMDKPGSLIIAGYFGFGNLGDELILTSMVNGLRAQKPDIAITVLSGSPQSTQKAYKVDSIAWQDYPTIVKAISSCDLVILGGGGLFHDYWGVDSKAILTSAHSGFAFYASVALLAAIYKKKLMLSAVGVGPIFSDQGRQLMKSIASQAELITVRDRDSQQQLINLGIPGQKITLTADAVFSLANTPSPKAATPFESILLGVSLRHWDVGIDPAKWQQEIALALDLFLDAHPTARVQFIPMQNSKEHFLDDYGLSRSIQRSLRNKVRTSILPRNSSIADCLSSIAQCSLFLGMRLHSIILALMNQLPVIGINYDPKVQALLSQFNMENNLVSPSKLESTHLFGMLEENIKNRSELSSHLQKGIPQLARLASHNFEMIIRLLQSKPAVLPLQSETINILSDSALGLSISLDQVQKQNIELEKKNLQGSQMLALEVNQKAVLNNELQSLQKEFRDFRLKSESQKQALQSQLSKLTDEFNQRKDILNQNLQELESIKTSRGWKLLFKLWELRLFLIPKDSKRESLFRTIFFPKQQISPQLSRKAARWIKRSLSPKLSWPALAFRSYRIKRQHLWPQNLAEINKNYEQGLVSIVLPVHNGERYVAEAIQSVLDQTYTHFELIIVDDGSTDRTPSIITDFAQKDQRIRVIRQANQKLPGALNTGFKSAQGEYFTWTSDDNLLTPEFIKKMVDCLCRHPRWHMVYANIDLIDDQGLPLRNSTWFEGYQFPHHSEHIHLPTDPSELNIVPNNYIGGAFLYRRQVAELLAGYSPFQYTREDYDYWMQINSLFTLKHTDFKESVYKYRMHSTSLTSQDADLKITEDRKYLMAFEDFRRDFYLMPLIWVFEDDQFENPTITQIKNCLHKHGQITISLSDFFHQILPIKWIPCIHIKKCATLEEKEAFLSTPQEFVYTVAVLTSDEQHTSPVCNFTLSVDQQVQTLAESSTELQTSLKAIDIKCRSLALRNIESQTHKPQPSNHKISVVICTYNRNAQLELSIRAIARQTIPQTDYEVIIVDNNPDYSELIPLIEQNREWEFFRYPEALRLVQCPIRGLSYARNAGLSEARGEWVLFLDDDAMAESDLIEKYLETIENHPKVGLIGGHIQLLLPKNLEMPWKPGWERYWSHFETNYLEFTPVSHWAEFPWGANWCARREVLFQIGGFRGAYGRRGEDFNGGEEIIAASLIQKLGYTIGILPQAKVIHEVDPSRFSLSHLKHTILAGQLVRYHAELDQYLPRDLSLSINPLHWVKKLQIIVLKSPPGIDANDQIQKLETSYIISAKRKMIRKHLLTECARFKFLYPLLKHLL